MSRIAKAPVFIPKSVNVNVDGKSIFVKGVKGEINYTVNHLVDIKINDDAIVMQWDSLSKSATAQAGTARAIINNMVTGVSDGFELKLSLVGVGYRAQIKEDVLSLSLGFSHPVDFIVPSGVTVETPSQVEIIVKGIDKQLVGQVAANIRKYRSPEPYKGKGVRYSNENVVRKEAKKK
ncbi:MAG: 50S ribosomal protein L6 [Methylococcaceae bacterium]|nr:50S ribosomal protein L6 [Methylococcaceae bacterium]MDZ4157080.1 50S ribosomal protein L6 [Methylococcales bacterium]MDP2394165.1 50S ribosomal protein L6 [Methylococcaceae bacterium]MDP3019993.1 50S ribosomal protein L6 [Methylococcaceae bacterium]MDP3388735.1 50S ribosomal protein L6 [Methylococcaceae bacterium]